MAKRLRVAVLDVKKSLGFLGRAAERGRNPRQGYNSDDFAAMFSGFWGDGIIPNVSTALLVEPIENSFAVVVNPDGAFIKGRFYQNMEDKQFTLSNGNAEERVDYIALRFDSEKRSVCLKYLEGAERQGSPLYARSGSLFDLLLAKITVPANAQYLTDEMVRTCGELPIALG